MTYAKAAHIVDMLLEGPPEFGEDPAEFLRAASQQGPYGFITLLPHKAQRHGNLQYSRTLQADYVGNLHLMLEESFDFYYVEAKFSSFGYRVQQPVKDCRITLMRMKGEGVDKALQEKIIKCLRWLIGIFEEKVKPLSDYGDDVNPNLQEARKIMSWAFEKFYTALNHGGPAPSDMEPTNTVTIPPR